jgi:hypothetical protein
MGCAVYRSVVPVYLQATAELAHSLVLRLFSPLRIIMARLLLGMFYTIHY